ncbi:MAG: PorT family protein, partial [Flavobacteriaceae bacterium]|nr:PorT family protein [Flavobacteriaceae bacterium]
MKKIMLMLVLSSMFLNELVAQDLTFGAKAGVNLSTLTNNDDYDSRYGIHFGAVAEWEISD